MSLARVEAKYASEILCGVAFKFRTVILRVWGWIGDWGIIAGKGLDAMVGDADKALEGTGDLGPEDDRDI